MKGGVIGLGNIGGGVAKCLARANMLAAIHDVFPEVAEQLGVGLPDSGSPRAVAEVSDVVLLAVFDAKQARDVLIGPDGVLAAARPGLSVVLLSTVGVDEYQSLRQLANEVGVELLDCGVTGGTSAANNGLVCLIGGDEDAVERARPVLDGFAKGVFRMGGPGAGMAGKISRNVIVYGTWQAEHEAFQLAKAAGVDGAQLVAVVTEARNSMSPPATWARSDPDFGFPPAEDARRERGSDLVSKDLGAALELAERVGVKLPSTAMARSRSKVITGLEKVG